MRLLGSMAGRACKAAALAAFIAASLTIAQASASAQLTETQKLYSSDPAGTERFGTSVALDGDWMVAGTPRDAIGSTNDGSVFVFRNDGVWTEHQKLVATSPTTTDFFGTSTDLDGGVLVVGAPGDDEVLGGSGAAYVFRYDAGTMLWVFEAKLKSPNAATSDAAGQSVSVSGDVIAVGSPDSDGAGSRSGSVDVYRFDGTQWLHEQTLTASDASTLALFGEEVCIDGEVIAVGAEGETNVTGAVYVFEYDGSTWNELSKLQPADLNERDRFGVDVQVHGDLIVAGAMADDEGREDTGSAWIFRRGASSWDVEAFLTAPTARRWNEFGIQVAVHGERVAIGANLGEEGASLGAVYVYGGGGGGWSLLQTIEPADAMPSSFGGSDLELRPDRLLVGRLADDTLAGDAGAISIYEECGSQVRLSITPNAPATGDPIEALSECGLPNGVFLLQIRSIDDVPLNYRLLIGRHDASGQWSLSSTTPPSVAGLQIGFEVLGFATDGSLSISNPVEIDFQ